MTLIRCLILNRLSFLLIAAVIVTSSAATAVEGFSFGGGLYAQNSMGRTTKSDDGSSAFLGSYSFPLGARYSMMAFDPISLAPSLWYTPLGRSSGGGTAKTTLLHLSLTADWIFAVTEIGEYDLMFGPGISLYTITGAGGTKNLSNGTGTSTFGVPGGEASIKTLTLDLGAGWNHGPHRIGFDIYTESLLSSQRRTFSFFLNYMYSIGDMQ